MEYKFKCEKCQKEEMRNIKLSEYDVLKNKQFCKCGEKMQRVIEWQGTATGSGEGWYGKNGSNTI